MSGQSFLFAFFKKADIFHLEYKQMKIRFYIFTLNFTILNIYLYLIQQKNCISTTVYLSVHFDHSFHFSWTGNLGENICLHSKFIFNSPIHARLRGLCRICVLQKYTYGTKINASFKSS